MAKKKSPITVPFTISDRVVRWFNPAGALRRVQARAALTALEENGYIVPASPRRSVRSWNPSARNADQDTIPKIDKSRAGCRDLAMNSPIARGALKRELTNVVGWGLRLQARIDRKALGLSDIAAEEWERRTEREFRYWAESVHCDRERTSNFYQLQSLALYNTSLSGEVFVVLPYLKKSPTPYQLRVKLIEADMCVNPNNRQDTNRLAGGIEVDDSGAPVRYYFKKMRPEELLRVPNTFTYSTVKIPAFDKSGRQNVHHLYHKERPGQRRGMPMFAPVVETLKQITRLTEAELMASVVTAFFTVFIKTNPAYGGLTDGFIPQEKVTNPDENPADENIYEMGNGNVIELGGEGQEIDVADPKRPNEAFEPFFMSLVKQIGSAIEIPFEQLMLYFSASYSAARGAILEAWKFYRHRRVWLVESFCQPVYMNFLEEAVLKGRIVAPGFLEDPVLRMAWGGAYWNGPGQGQLNPLQETQAADLRIQRTLSTYQDEYSSIHGADWTTAVERNAREVELLREKNIPVPQPENKVTEEKTEQGEVE